MISFLTGTRQIGKTTWLKRLVPMMQERGIPLWGFITPAVFEGDVKTGIDAVVYPGGETFPMATLAEGATRKPFDPSKLPPVEQQRPQSHWNFSDEAMERINQALADNRGHVPSDAVLLLDELGPLEMFQGKGIVEAMDILDAGDFSDSIVVIRPELMEQAVERWGSVSEGGCETIYPDQMPAFLK